MNCCARDACCLLAQATTAVEECDATKA